MSAMRYPTKPLSVVSFASPQFFCPYRLSSLSTRRCLSLENYLPSVMSQTSSTIYCLELSYLSFADVTWVRSPDPNFLTSILLRSPTIGARDFGYPKKRQGKKVSWIIFSTPKNVSLVYQVTCCRNIYSGCIVNTTTA